MKDHMTWDNLKQKVAALCKERDELRRKIDQLVIRLNDETEKVTRLETECREKEQQIKNVIKERDAAIADLKTVALNCHADYTFSACFACEHNLTCNGQPSNGCEFEWRGVQDKNNKME